MKRRLFVPGLLLLALVACRSTPMEKPVIGDVGVSMIPPSVNGKSMPLQASQAFVYPNLVAPVAMPEYPPGLLALRLEPVVVCIEVDIDEVGKVAMVRPRVDDACPATAGDAREFAAMVDAAVRQWNYDAALVCTTPDGQPAEDACAVEGAIEKPTKVRLSYAFRFTQQDGKPSVERL